MEDILPPVGIIIIEGIQRVLRGGGRLVILREHIPVAPEVVIGTVEGRLPAVGLTVATREDVAVVGVVVVPDALVLCQEIVHAALTVATHL